MTVRRIFVSQELYDVTGAGYEPRGQMLKDGAPVLNDDLSLIAKVGGLCNDASVTLDSAPKIVGDPTEVAFARIGGEGR
jgi:Ca2+-transporting ATPase